jgi:xylulokinase
VWVKKHEPEIFDAVAKVLLPKAYIRYRMTGEHASDMSDASGTYWLDVARRDWSDDAARRHPPHALATRCRSSSKAPMPAAR